MACAVKATIGPPYPLAQPPRRLVAVQDRHLHVHQNDVEGPAFGVSVERQLDGHRSIVGHHHIRACSPQDVRHQVLVVGAIVCQQNPAVQLHQLSQRPVDPLAKHQIIWLRQQGYSGQRTRFDRDAERAALAGGAGDRDRAAEHLGQPLADGQPQSAAAKPPGGRTIGLSKRLKQPGDLFGGHADPLVDDVKPQRRFAAQCADQLGADANLAVIAELDGVAHQIEQDLPQASGIGGDGLGNLTGILGQQGQSLGFGSHPHQHGHFGDNLAGAAAHAFHSQLARLDLGQVEDVVDDVQQVLAVAVDGLGGLDVVGVRQAGQNRSA